MRHGRRRVLLAIVLLLTIQPVANDLAMQALWLHAIQGVILHAAPMLWTPRNIEGRAHPIYEGVRPWHVAGGSLFIGVASVAWMLPAPHSLVMRDVWMYHAMNATMLASGMGMLAMHRHGVLKEWSMALCALPQVAIGVLLLLSPPWYLFDMDLCKASSHWLLADVQSLLRDTASPIVDQRLAALILIASGLSAIAWCASPRAHSYRWRGARHCFMRGP